MDANGLRFWMLSNAADWHVFGTPPPSFDTHTRVLRLASARRLDPAVSEASTELVTPLLDAIPQTVDARGYLARWDAGRNAIVVDFPLGTTELYTVEAGQPPTDFLVGFDNVLYIALDGAVILRDLKQRWSDVTRRLDNFNAWRLAAAPGSGVFALDRDGRSVARLIGAPIVERPFVEYSPQTFRPVEENPSPPRLVPLAPLDFPGERAVAIASSPAGRVAILSWPEGAPARVRTLEGTTLSPPATLAGALRPFSIAWVDDTQLAVLLLGLAEAPVFALNGLEQLVPVGELYPLPGHTGGPFVHTLTQPPLYPADGAPRPLYHLSLPAFASGGTASGASAIDSGNPQTVWHRLYLEASIPPKTGVRIWLAATDRPAAPLLDSGEWHPHLFGETFQSGAAARIPRGAWCLQASELPFHDGLLPCPRQPGRAGLFTALIQRSDRQVTSLLGRYLWVRAELSGDGRTTPEIAAVRAYGSRFSYVDRYLPEIYKETLFTPDSDSRGSATPSDFLDRLLNLYESVLTPLEDRIAASYLLTDPRRVPEESLDWLAGWIGVTFDAGLPAARRREMLLGTSDLYRARGTLGGLELALELATGGALSGGEIVVLEDFRLRRTAATILGVDLADEDDPLLAGIVGSGNSVVGDTLILGNEYRREFLALFTPDLIDPEGPSEEFIESFFDRLAHRVTVLVHEEVEAQDLGLIRRVAALESPAHLDVKVLRATWPFMVAIASLIGIDTYLAEKPQHGHVRVNRSAVGGTDLLLGAPGFDPRRFTRPQSEAPVAQLPGELNVPFGSGFTLRSTGSRAAPGRRLTRHLWTRLT